MLSLSCQYLFLLLDSEGKTHLGTSVRVIRRPGALGLDRQLPQDSAACSLSIVSHCIQFYRGADVFYIYTYWQIALCCLIEKLDLKIGFSPSTSDSSIFISTCLPKYLSWVRLTPDFVTRKRRTTKQWIKAL